MDLNEKERLRYMLLKYVYEESKGNRLADVDLSWEYTKQFSANENEIDHAIDYLVEENLLDKRIMGPHYSISHYGIKEIESSIRNPKKSTEHFSGPNIIFVANMTNSQIQQSTSNSSQVITVNDVHAFEDALSHILSAAQATQSTPENREIVEMSIEGLKSQSKIAANNRDQPFINKCWERLNRAATLIGIGEAIVKYGPIVISYLAIS